MHPSPPHSPLLRAAPWLTGLLLLNGGYLLAAGDPSLFYVANVLGHLLLGLALLAVWIGLGAAIVRAGEGRSALGAAALALMLLAAGTGLALVVFGNRQPLRPVLWTHVVASVGACGATLAWLRQRGLFATKRSALRAVGIAGAVALVILGTRPLWPDDPARRIVNPTLPPPDLAGEAMGGRSGPFFPSAAATTDGALIPSDFFLDSQTCARSGCHPDVTAQWESSAHRFSSFNNQWYRKSIEYMQDVLGNEAPQWCAGCHDHALLFSGQMNQPVADFIDTPEAHAGLACISCHSVVQVKGTMGNGGVVLEYPQMHALASSDNEAVRFLHDLTVRLDPEPHRRAFLKPFHREQSSEFCASCHKVHLDVPVNNYRWLRGFNEYDNWQASGVSGEGARSFYAPEEPMTCVTCHMPHTPSDDAGSDGGFIRSHRFLAANTALPTANLDSVQLQQTIEFLQRKQVSVDIFAVSEPSEFVQVTETRGRDPLQIASTFAVGEEQARDLGGGGLTREATRVFAPLEDGDAVLQPGTAVRLDVVVRTLGLGHFFPGGTVDAQEAWLEVKAVDNRGTTLFWSGWTDGDAGPVEPSAHLFRSLMVDAHANPINKRNAWASRAVVYVNLIPPGAANTAHFRLQIPEDVGASLTITAKLHYRKFNPWHTRFSYAGVSADTGAVSPHFDDRRVAFNGDLRSVSGKLKAVPVLPIVTMATDEVTLKVAQEVGEATQTGTAADRTRWNDYAIGLLLQGDLKGAEQAFRRVTELDPAYADGWVNLARVYLQEGNLERAEEVLETAETTRPGFHKTRYFRGLIYKARGEYPEALRDLRAVAAAFPRDRVVQNQIGRVLYLSAALESAVEAFQNVLAIDPEDLMAHYNLALIYRGLGDEAQAKAHEVRYLRYKEDETTQALARQYRAQHPHDNNEALPIHEHPDAGPPPPPGR